MTPLLWFIVWFLGLCVFSALVLWAGALAIGSDADDIADATLDRINDCQDG